MKFNKKMTISFFFFIILVIGMFLIEQISSKIFDNKVIADNEAKSDGIIIDGIDVPGGIIKKYWPQKKGYN